MAWKRDLAMLWANELTEGPGRAALLGQIAAGMARSEPVAAFGLSDSVAPQEQRGFVNSFYAGWAAQDTAAALQSAEQLDDPTTREAALQAIRSVAPVGIGAAVTMQLGYPVITELVPDAPADLSGLLHQGDRILAIAQGDSSYVDAHNLSLQEAVQLIRGAPGTTLQLQVLSANAPPDSTPHLVTVVRDQIKYKRQ
jgi:predicted metalloprotease with PDZ domain